MRVELRDGARENLATGAWFYDRQSVGLGGGVTKKLREDRTAVGRILV